MKELLSDIIHDSMNQIRKKQSRTVEENYNEIYNRNDERVIISFINIKINQNNDSDDDGDENEPNYNPKNLPLGKIFRFLLILKFRMGW